MAIGLTAEAKPVDKTTAAILAARILNKTVVDATPSQFTGCHLFAGADGKGFVLLAADDRIRPVLAYSPDGTFDPTAMPDHVAAWIDGYQREIASVVEAGGSPSPKVAQEWERWSKGTARSNSTWVDPLMTSRWSQNPPYNNYCPYDTVYNAHAAVGCVATAMAQIMRYWQWPEFGYGSHSFSWSYYGNLTADFGNTYYNWNLMPDVLTNASSAEAKDAVATLMYHAGVAVDMMYHPEGSGAYTASSGNLDFPCAENAYKTYFRYNPMLQSRHKSAYTDTEWDALMRAELDAGRPVHYGAAEPYIHSGHAFVIDGYDSIGMYHVNWGWAGQCDAWYLIDSLAPGAGSMGGQPYYCFTGVAEAVFGIYPADMPMGEPSTISLVSNDPELGTVTGSGTYQTYDTVNVEAHAAEGYHTLNIYEGESLDDATPVYTKTYYLEGWPGWRTLEPDSTLWFAPEQTVWITFSFTDPTGWAAPVAGGTYCGNPDGSWYRFSESSAGWDIYHPISGYYTWLIRAVLSGSSGIDALAIGDNGSFAYVSNGQLIVNGEGVLQVIDVLGRQLYTKELSTANYQLPCRRVCAAFD